MSHLHHLIIVRFKSFSRHFSRSCVDLVARALASSTQINFESIFNFLKNFETKKSTMWERDDSFVLGTHSFVRDDQNSVESIQEKEEERRDKPPRAETS
jgi:hypothetical protein